MIVEERNYAFAPADIERFLAIYESEGVVIATHVLGNLLGYFALRSVTISTRSSIGGEGGKSAYHPPFALEFAPAAWPDRIVSRQFAVPSRKTGNHKRKNEDGRG